MKFALSIFDPDMRQRRDYRLQRPRTSDQLHSYIRIVLGFNIPRLSTAAGHSAPFEYVKHAFFEERQPRDMIVWANRGGGKTQLGAIVTLLDLLFKPGIQIRILGGSFEQSSKMHRYLAAMLASDVFNDLIAGHVTGRHVELRNGSRVEVLAQSQRSVRGQRVHKLRCDEVELFDPDVWEAAQLVTRSGRCGSIDVGASIECLSTMHRPFGLMQKLLRESENANRRVFRWNVLDTLTRCTAQRRCESCTLWDECRGAAKSPTKRGFIHIDDAIQQKHRVTPHTWAAEMLCERPSAEDLVYPEFNERVHIVDDSFPDTGHLTPDTCALCIGGIDFGYRAPTAMLWGVVDQQGILHIIDELIESGITTETFIAQAETKSVSIGRPQWIGADPAGHQRSEHTGVSTITLWKRHGWTVRTRQLQIEPGIEAVRRRLLSADGTVRLRIHRRCEKLIEALSKYHYSPLPREGSISERVLLPVKDGPDHAADALRYMITNLDHERDKLIVRNY